MPDMEIVRTHLSPRCCCTSSVSFGGLVLDFVFDGQRVIDAGQCLRKFDVDHRTDDLNNFAFVTILATCVIAFDLPHSDCPPAISSNSFVILPWRSLLYSRVKSLIRLSALSVAFFIETMRALCSLALAFSRT